MGLVRPVLVSALLLAACGSGESSGSDDRAKADEPGANASMDISNQGGSMESHTPRGFAGSGRGLFAGDNLNQGFPDGEGVQLWLTFDLPAGTPAPASARLTSDALHVAGTPFDDLGVLVAEPVTYDGFSRELFDLPAGGASTGCDVVGDDRLECDVTDAVVAAVNDQAERAQFRLKFERLADDDGAQDLALFFLTDFNTNEPGIFTLELR